MVQQQQQTAREITVPAVLSSIATLRHWAVDHGRGAGASHGALAAVELTASEVVTNAVVHTPATVDVTMRFSLDGPAMYFEVQDDEQTLPRVRARDAGTPGGLGLHLVEALSDRWGCRLGETGGKVVWFAIGLG